VALGIASRAGAASIGLFADPNCTLCNLEIPSGQSGTFYISAVNVGDSPDLSYGTDGAELRVIGLPAGWSTQAQRSPQSNISIGDPMQCGANIAFPTRQTSNCILLYTVSVQATSQVSEAQLRVVEHCTPSHPLYPCPLLVHDIGPAFIRLCVPGGSLFINSSHPCNVSIQGTTWAGVKQLYD